ncbi:MAG: LysR substrate-binding domain-containing protein [Deltaproteobacteria bacterium]
MPRLHAFLAAHPDLRIPLSAAFSDSDFSRGEVDLDIRYGVVRGGELHVETIFREEILPLASPEFLKDVAIREPERPARVAIDPFGRERRAVATMVRR